MNKLLDVGSIHWTGFLLTAVFLISLSVAQSPDPDSQQSVTPPDPSNQPHLFNPFFTNNDTQGYDDQGLACERERETIIIISAAYGAIMFCVFLVLMTILFAFLRKIWQNKRLVRTLRGLEESERSSTGTIQLPSPKASPRSEKNQFSTISQQCSSSPIEVSSNPSYCMTTLATDSVHHYDDIMALTRKETEAPSEVYDRLESSPVPNAVAVQSTLKTSPSQSSLAPPPCPPRPLRSKPTLKSSPQLPRRKSTPKSPPRPPRSKPTPTVKVQRSISSSTIRVPNPPIPPSQQRKEYRLSAVSEGYVNEFDGPPCAYGPNSQLHPSPSLRFDPSPPAVAARLQWRRGDPCTYKLNPPQEYETPLAVKKSEL